MQKGELYNPFFIKTPFRDTVEMLVDMFNIFRTSEEAYVFESRAEQL